MTTQSSINLNTCVPGQKVKLRCGTIVQYEHSIPDCKPYEHAVNGYIYMNDGCYWSDHSQNDLDVVEILPMELTSGIDLNTCVRGQRVKLRDETIATYNGVIDENEIYTHSVDDYSYTERGTFWYEDDRTSPKDVVEILPMEEEPTKPTPELTHSITDQIDVTNPDHVSIIPHEHGVTISIKKGLTTISWRHYNS
jgi:hypothetical protein